MKAGKILPRAELAARLAAPRQRGERIVLMNGVFDLLHVGHVRALQDARRRGDLLVVAVNGDAAATRLKGPGRPVQPAADRAEILAALECVDLVCVFEEDTLAATLRVLRPAVHAKGADYVPEAIPASERRAAAELGIELARVGGEKSRSTTDLVRRLGAGESPA